MDTLSLFRPKSHNSYSSSSSPNKCRFMRHLCRNYRTNSAVPMRSPRPVIPLKTKTKTTTTTSILHLMDVLRLPVSVDMYNCLIKECTWNKDSIRALELHDHIVKRRSIKPTLSFLNRLLLMHVSCGELCVARQLFDEMTLKDFNSWAIMIVGYIDVAEYEESITLFVEMVEQQKLLKTGHMLLEFPAWIIICILKACVCTMNMEFGKQIHGLLFKLGTSSDISLSGSLINFYGKFRCLEDADFVFSQLRRHNTVVWTAKIVNNCRERNFREVFDDFKEMGRERIKKNSYTLSSVLKACGMVDDGGNCGRQVHANAIKIGLESDMYVQCGLVDMYGKCGLLKDAKRVFQLVVNNENTAAWNAMLMGYSRNGFYVEAIKFLYQMKASGIQIQESLIKDVRIACVSDSNTFQNKT
ncbi:putative Pentatricopeptide repeat-containing protein [Melia azedarach]|uniref:Pentatricopeptide repeat-containing protein n=2 Tax=Melia azedarach TaxID=155640 RepID=A0ACC1XGH5_MELAZ|nr:putative Pentatricopeptide repeat-containing protein [Melia azedarach]KAJ4710354.1 putative Pentatricopeptide repeat-containing protein [Melia azedarach]